MCMCMCMCMCLCMCLSVCLSVSLSVCVCVCLSVCVSGSVRFVFFVGFIGHPEPETSERPQQTKFDPEEELLLGGFWVA